MQFKIDPIFPGGHEKRALQGDIRSFPSGSQKVLDCRHNLKTSRIYLCLFYNH